LIFFTFVHIPAVLNIFLGFEWIDEVIQLEEGGNSRDNSKEVELIVDVVVNEEARGRN